TYSPCFCNRSECVDLIFFFQAEDGIRDFHVTGVQTCALPISPSGAICSPPSILWTMCLTALSRVWCSDSCVPGLRYTRVMIACRPPQVSVRRPPKLWCTHRWRCSVSISYSPPSCSVIFNRIQGAFHGTEKHRNHCWAVHDCRPGRAHVSGTAG